MKLSGALSTLVLLGVQFALARPLATPTTVNTVTLNGVTYINKGLVGFGRIPSNFRESTGDTLGGIGSAIALKPGTWTQGAGGEFNGTLIVHPDRGFNVDGTINYQARHHEIDFQLTPYYDSKKLSFSDALDTLQLTYRDTVLEVDVNGARTSGLDPQGIRSPTSGANPQPFPSPLPIVATVDDRLVLDVEGLIANPDGSFWISDEYGPGIYRFSAGGQLEQSLPIPEAIMPQTKSGQLNFTSVVDPAFGRAANQGFEGLTIDREAGILYAMLQSATIQDGGDDKSTSRYTRLLGFDINGNNTDLVGEWVVPLPLSGKGNTEAASEIIFVRPGIFMALARDGDGRGGDDLKSSYKQADLFSITGATDIHGSKFDSHLNPIAVKGKLNSAIVPAQYVSFVDFVDDDQLARFGLHNGSPDDQTLISAKWESLALAPANDPSFLDDFFLFTVSDNDFISTQGVSLGVPFNAGLDNDNQFMVFRVTLPGSPH